MSDYDIQLVVLCRDQLQRALAGVVAAQEEIAIGARVEAAQVPDLEADLAELIASAA